MINGNQIDSSYTKTNLHRKINKLNLFATVRILLHVLSNENPPLRMVAQKVLKDSYKLHQRYSEVTSLAALIEIGLREVVGEKYWAKAKAIQRRKCSVSFKSACKKSVDLVPRIAKQQ